jgi:ATP-binding cassette subfamily B protein
VAVLVHTVSETAEKQRSIFSYLRVHATALAFGVFLLFITNGLDKAIPWLLAYAVDALREGRLSAVGQYALWVIAIAAVMWVVRTASRIVIFNIGRDVEYELRNELLARLHLLGGAFFRRMATGDIMSRATNDLTQVRLLTGFGALHVFNTIFAFGGALGLMIAISPVLTLWALTPLPLFVVATRAFSKAMYVRSQEAQEALASLADRAQENLTGIRLVRAYGIEEHATAVFEEANQRALDRNMRLVVIRGVMWPVMMGLSSVGTIIVIWVGGAMVVDGDMTIGEFAAFNAYLAQLIWPTMALGFILSVVQRGRVSYRRVRDILDAKPEIVEIESPKKVKGEGAVSVTDLRYAYGDNEVLGGVDLDVPARGSIAIVGRTGSGKSTLAALLPRLLPTPKGTVHLDGDDVTEIELAPLRKTVGYAQQEPFLFSSTVTRNVAFALEDPDAEDAEARIRAALAEAAILEEIEALPDGFDTVVGERGVQLSGGQKQRIALARALLAEPAVLVLDDPLSAVDARTEATILKALDRAGEGRTLILVTNRIAAARRTQQIVVLEEGKVVERGTHEELEKAGGLYARIAVRQRLEEELSVL